LGANEIAIPALTLGPIGPGNVQRIDHYCPILSQQPPLRPAALGLSTTQHFGLTDSNGRSVHFHEGSVQSIVRKTKPVRPQPIPTAASFNSTCFWYRPAGRIGGVVKSKESQLLFPLFGLEVLTISSCGSQQKHTIASSFPPSFPPVTMMFRNSILLLATAVVVKAQVRLVLLLLAGCGSGSGGGGGNSGGTGTLQGRVSSLSSPILFPPCIFLFFFFFFLSVFCSTIRVARSPAFR
jgi:hypothetical protein